MKNSFFMIVYLVLSSMGCSSVYYQKEPVNNAEIMRTYLYKIDKSDGINKEEAVIIAQSELISRGLDAQYALSKPVVEEDENTWQIVFFPVNRTLGEVIDSQDVWFVIDKQTGQII